jgi:glycosyltransferase involved in cell wall biosynthesis
VGGIPDFVRQRDNGLLVRPGDATALASALLDVLQDPVAARTMGERGRRRVVAGHDWDRLAAATETAFEAAVAAHRGGTAAGQPAGQGPARPARRRAGG